MSLALRGSPATLEVYKVTSGDSGKKYYVQVLSIEREMGRVPNTTILVCNCNEGYFRIVLAILGIEDPCKHTIHLKEYLEERKKK